MNKLILIFFHVPLKIKCAQQFLRIHLGNNNNNNKLEIVFRIFNGFITADFEEAVIK